MVDKPTPLEKKNQGCQEKFSGGKRLALLEGGGGKKKLSEVKLAPVSQLVGWVRLSPECFETDLGEDHSGKEGKKSRVLEKRREERNAREKKELPKTGFGYSGVRKDEKVICRKKKTGVQKKQTGV